MLENILSTLTVVFAMIVMGVVLFISNKKK